MGSPKRSGGATGGTYDAVILAGGAGRRLGGVDKPGLVVGGRSLIARVAGAVGDAQRLVVVGPPRAELPHAVVVREDPPGAGPVAALRTGLAAVRADEVVVLAADLPFLRPEHIAALRAPRPAAQNAAAGDPAGPGAIAVDDDGRAQWLLGAWRTERLREAMACYEGASLGGVMEPLHPRLVRLESGPRAGWRDCDTDADVERVRSAMLEKWIESVCAELGLDPAQVDRDLVLDMAKDVAHGVARPAAPLTAYLMGLAVGRGQAATDVAARISSHAAAWKE